MKKLIYFNRYKVIGVDVGEHIIEWEIYFKDKWGRWRHSVTLTNTKTMLSHIGLI